MATNLTATGSSQSQNATQDPQSAVQPANSGAQSSRVQPGTTESLLHGQGGVALHGTALSTVSLNPAPSAVQTQTRVTVPSAPKHHVNMVLVGVAAVLLLVAAVLFWLTSKSVKNTT